MAGTRRGAVVFDTDTDTDSGPAVVVSLADMRERFRLTANVVDVVPPTSDLPHLPVARAVWEPRPDFTTSSECWLTAGGAHHTVLTTAVVVQRCRTSGRSGRIAL